MLYYYKFKQKYWMCIKK